MCCYSYSLGLIYWHWVMRTSISSYICINYKLIQLLLFQYCVQWWRKVRHNQYNETRGVGVGGGGWGWGGGGEVGVGGGVGGGWGWMTKHKRGHMWKHIDMYVHHCHYHKTSMHNYIHAHLYVLSKLCILYLKWLNPACLLNNDASLVPKHNTNTENSRGCLISIWNTEIDR